MLKDDKTYPYIKVTVSEEYPRILFSRMMKRIRINISTIYQCQAVKDTIELILLRYTISEPARESFPRISALDRLRLYYHIHQCDAPVSYVSKEEYQQSVKQALDFWAADMSLS